MWKRNKQIFFDQAQLPTVEQRNDEYRVFYSYRIEGRSHINYFEVNKKLELVYRNDTPVLSPGDRGCFDDKGVMPSCLVGNLLYYTGWNTDKGLVPYGHGIGVAVWHDKTNRFERLYRGPILDRGIETPFLVNSPFVLQDSDKMLFCNGTGWDGDFPTYNICCKKDGIISAIVGDAHEACSRPVIHNDVVFFSKRTKDTSYEIFSYDGSLKKELAKADNGWDSEMVCYPYFCNEYMFYNGNGYGASGVGVCVQE